METIGNAEDAKTIRDAVRNWERGYNPWQDLPRPEGWEFLGSGAYRSVWQSPDGVAYKVTHRKHSDQSNSGEWENYLRINQECQLPAGTRTLKCYLWDFGGDDVLACERVNGQTLTAYHAQIYSERGSWNAADEESKDLYHLMYKIDEEVGLYDMHSENVMVDEDGTLVLVDMAS